MFTAFSGPHNRKRTYALLAICIVLAIAATIIGIDDNPPGIILAYLAAVAFVLALVHPWKTSNLFRNLAFASLAGFVVFAVLHNVFEFAASKIQDSSIIVELLNFTGTVFFLIAIMLCPIGLLVGVIGALTNQQRERNS